MARNQTKSVAQRKIEILGIYRAKVSAAARKEALQYKSVRQFDAEIRRLVLIEVRVTDAGKDFEHWAVCQAKGKSLKPNDQVGYDDKILNDTGTGEHESGLTAVPPRGAFRYAMFIHEFDRKAPLTYAGKKLETPALTVMPRRLSRLFKYMPVG